MSDPADPSTPQPEGLVAEIMAELDLTVEQVAALPLTVATEIGTDRLFARRRTLSVSDMAERLGADRETVIVVWRSLGVTVEDDRPFFHDADLALTAALVASTESIFELREGLEMLRVIGASLARIADALVSEYVRNPQHRLKTTHPSSYEAFAESVVATELAFALGDQLGTVFVHHMRQAIENQRRGQRATGRPDLTRVGIGFVDLVGFTELSRALSVDELGRLVTDFEEQAHDAAADHRARIVKHIGDEVMFVAYDAASTRALAMDLLERGGRSGIEPRGGVAFGDAITMHGDYYGPVVNLASRLADHATPGEILADAGLVDAVGGRWFDPAGRRMLKGFDEPVAVWTVRAEPVGPAG